MAKPSQALRDFRTSLSIAETLMKRERRFSDPPPPRNFKIVQGLRGGAAVLMVAAFENYLKEVVEERLYLMTQFPLRFNPANVPEAMTFHNFSKTLDRSLRGPFSISEPTRADKITFYQQASQVVVRGIINSTVFSDLTRSNPNAKKVTELFKSLGIPDIFTQIKADFDAEWGSPTATKFIQDTLNSILDRRHEVAHTAVVLNVSRRDLEISARFLRILAKICDQELRRHINHIMR